MPLFDFQIHGGTPAIRGMRARYQQELPAQARAAVLRHDEELLQPGGQPAVLEGPLEIQIGHADRLITSSSHQKAPAPAVGEHSVDARRQLFGGKGDLQLDELPSEKLEEGSTVGAADWANAEFFHGANPIARR
jgi:hypothetical protein